MDKPLKAWCTLQRKNKVAFDANEKTTITAARVAQLESIRFGWATPQRGR
jgi:hypothetical protein|eukprot:COSAG06_NODE_47_length_29196_cov_53.194178_9_plen_50_part_00